MAWFPVANWLQAAAVEVIRVKGQRVKALRKYLSEHAKTDLADANLPGVLTTLDALRAAARETQALHVEVRQEVALPRQLTAHVKRLEQRCETLYRAVHPSDAMRSIPGIGSALAAELVAVIANPRRFRNERQLRGFCGLFPTTSSSGGKTRPGQRITQGGNNRLKRALYLAADVARQIDPDLAEVYWRLMVHKGHPRKQALCAVATRLVNRIHRVLKTGDAYVLRNRDGQPISVEQGKAIVAAQFRVPETIRSSRRVHAA